MKRLLFLIASVLLVACGGKDAYTVKGSIEGVDEGTVVTLSVLEYGNLNSVDSVALKGGKFTFKGRIDTANVAVVTFDMDGSVGGCKFYLERGKIDINLNVIDGYQQIGGTPNNDVCQRFYDDTEALSDEADEIEDKIRITLASQGDCTDLYRQMGDLQERFKDLLAQSIMDNAGLLYAYEELMENYTLFEPEEILPMLEKLAPKYGSDLMFGQLTSIVNAQLSTSLGHTYIDFEAPILDKKYGFEGKASLSQYVQKNKIVLLDFWASWCGPCMNEVPNLKAAYKKFKSKGFEIVSVSVDDSTEDWIKAVKDNGMNWVQLWNGSEEDAVNSAAVKYSVSAIPCTYLIDAEGTIIGRNLRDSELEEALEDYFKN